MMYVIPVYWLRADLPSGPIQLLVPGPALNEILAVLNSNHATSVSYALEPSNKKEIIGVACGRGAGVGA